MDGQVLENGTEGNFDLNSFDFDPTFQTYDSLLDIFSQNLECYSPFPGEISLSNSQDSVQDKLSEISSFKLHSELANHFAQLEDCQEDPSHIQTDPKNVKKKKVTKNSNKSRTASSRKKISNSTSTPANASSLSPLIPIVFVNRFPIGKVTTEFKEKKEETDEKYKKRLISNKRSAQASRERKKLLKNELEAKLAELRKGQLALLESISELETENKVLKREFMNLQQLISDSALLSKLLLLLSSNSNSNGGSESIRMPELFSNGSNCSKMLFNPTLSPESLINGIHLPVIGQSEKNPLHPSKSNSSSPPNFNEVSNAILSLDTPMTASMYMMIVLQTFSQLFKSFQNSSSISSAMAQPFPACVL